MVSWRGIILGELASKANSRELVINPRTKRPMFIKSAKARIYERDAAKQLPTLDPLLRGPLCLDAWIFYATNRPDLDESLLMDVMQEHIYENDRQIRVKHIYHEIDAQNPRCEVIVTEIEP